MILPCDAIYMGVYIFLEYSFPSVERGGDTRHLLVLEVHPSVVWLRTWVG